MNELIVLATLVLFGGWIAAAVLGVLLWRARRKLRDHTAQPATYEPARAAARSEELSTVYGWLVLRHEIRGQRGAAPSAPQPTDADAADEHDGGDVVQDEPAEIASAEWAAASLHYLRAFGITPGSAAGDAAAAAAHRALHIYRQSVQQPDAAALDAPVPAPADDIPATARGDARRPSTGDAATPAVAADSTMTVQGASSAMAAALTPAPPGPLERLLATASGWPRVLLPFVAQNIGWFIGLFCMLAGSAFLVSYASGFFRSLTLSAVMTAYTAASVGAGYHLLRSNPRLRLAGQMLMSFGLLLAPLALAAVARLFLDTGANPFKLAGALATAAVAVSVFYWLAMLVGSVTHRVLGRDFARMFLALAAAQLVVGLVARWPVWPLLAVVHGAIIAVLAYAVLRNTATWLRSVFDDRERIALFAAGSLIYTATISLLHVTFGIGGVDLPRGYIGPFLMVVVALALYVDAQLRTWRQGAIAISAFALVMHALVAGAIVIAWPEPAVRHLTLLLAIGVQASAAWQRISLLPWYSALAYIAVLFGSVVLAALPAEWHLLAATPLIAALEVARQRLVRMTTTGPVTRAFGARVAVVLSAATVLLAAWSLASSAPGVLAMATAAAASACAWWLWPRDVPKDDRVAGLRRALAGVRFYLPFVGITVVAGFAPVLPGSTWPVQLTVTLVLLAAVWTGLLLRPPPLAAHYLVRHEEVLVNATLVTLVAALALAAGLTLGAHLSPLGCAAVLVAVTVVLATLAVSLRARVLMYAAVVVAGVALALLKIALFPAPSYGRSALLGGALLWAWLWWLERGTPNVLEDARIKVAGLLWYPRRTAGARTLGELLAAPSRLALGAAVLIGAVMMTLGFAAHDIRPVGVVSLLLLAGHLALGGLRLGWPALLAPAVVCATLGVALTAWLLGLRAEEALAGVIAAAALFIWRGSLGAARWLGSASSARWLPGPWRHGRRACIRGLTLYVYRSCLGVVIVALLAAAVFAHGVMLPASETFTLLLALVFLSLGLTHRRSTLSASLLVAIGLWGACSAWALLVAGQHWLPIDQPSFAIALAAIGTAAYALRNALAPRSWRTARIRRLSASLDSPLHIGATVSCVGAVVQLAVLLLIELALPGLAPDAGPWLLIALLAVAVLNGSLAWRERLPVLFVSAGISALLFAHAIWLAGAPNASLAQLLPWWSLQLALCALVLGVPRVAAWWLFNPVRVPLAARGRDPGVAAGVLVALGGIEWLLHLGFTWHQVATMGSSSVFGGIAGHVVAVTAAVLLMWLAARRLVTLGRDPSDSLLLLGSALVLIYLRLLWLGLAPLGAVDTVAAFVSAGALMLVQRRWPSTAISWATGAVPLLALLTIPIKPGSVHACVTLVAISAVYLLRWRHRQSKLSLGVALAALNAAVYLWVPAASAKAGLLQLYVIPAALSLLLLARLYRAELQPKARSYLQIAALSAIYAAATADVFIGESFFNFVLALGLGFAGIAAGIGWRVRAFLYVGIAFVVVNVLGQLVMLYPEARLARAMVLIGTGTVVTMMMVWFSIKREAILARVRVFRADLDGWS